MALLLLLSLKLKKNNSKCLWNLVIATIYHLVWWDDLCCSRLDTIHTQSTIGTIIRNTERDCISSYDKIVVVIINKNVRVVAKLRSGGSSAAVSSAVEAAVTFQIPHSFHLDVIRSSHSFGGFAVISPWASQTISTS